MIEDQDEYDEAIKRKRRQLHQQQQQIDDDSMRRHEIDRGSDIGYAQRESLKRQMATEDANVNNRDQLFIKDGNAEILRLITRGKNEDENIYVNIPPQPQYIMVDNSGKEILMRRFIEEQANGKHIIREHYQIVPGAATSQMAINETLQNAQLMNDMYVKSRAGSIVYSQHGGNVDQVKIVHAHNENNEAQLQHAISSQSLIHQELEQSIKQQNALLRQILLEKEKLEEKYTQQEVALETQSLPGHAMAMATQTDCDAGTQTDSHRAKPARRRARSENDDSLSDNEYEYVRYSPPNSPEGVYWVKRKRHKKRAKYKADADKPRRRVVMVDMKRKIRTPIKEESEDVLVAASPPMQQRTESRSRSRQSYKSDVRAPVSRQRQSSGLTRDVLLEIDDSLNGQKYADDGSPTLSERRRYVRKINAAKQMEYYVASDDDVEEEDDSDNDIVIRENVYSGDSLEEFSDAEDLADKRTHGKYSAKTTLFPRRESLSDDAYRRHITSRTSVASSPARRTRLTRQDSELDGDHIRHRRHASSDAPQRSTKGPAPKPPSDIRRSKRDHSQDTKSRSESDLVHKLANADDAAEVSRSNIPRYMEWYYNKPKDSDLEKKRLDEYRIEKERSKVSNKKMVGAIEKRIKSKAPKAEAKTDEYKYKPEPMPRTVPAKNGRLLREDVQMNKSMASKIQTDTNHPLLQYSEHRYEHEYDPQPDIPLHPSKLPHYMYPQTPPIVTTRESKQQQQQQRAVTKQQQQRPKPSPIKEHEVKESRSKIPVNAETNHHHHTKQLNATTLEDDHDSGIAMNSLLHSMGKRNPIADKKSVFTIAYDDVKVRKIQSESDSPQFP